MSIVRPFSSNEISNLREIFEKSGFKINRKIDNYFRYSISTRDKVLLFSLKFPVEMPLPLRLKIPFEVATFRISMVFKLWNLTQKTFKVLIYLMKMLRNLFLQVSTEYKFPVKGLENKIAKLLNLIMPEPIKDENESAWLNRIRISLLNKRDKIKEFDKEIINSLVETLDKVGLNPSFEQPWEIKKGIPKIRTTETLLFSNEEQEFFILEKGYFTYFKDIEYNKFYLRSFFETYTPFILNELFGDLPEFNLNIYLENWIKYTRLLLNSMIEIIDGGKLNQSEFLNFRPKKALDTLDFELEENNFPFTALHYENFVSKELSPLDYDLFDKPPSNFEVIEAIKNYKMAKELVSFYKFKEASEIFNDSLKILNKYKQKKAVVSILLRLRKIASILNKKNMALNYLQNALEVAKSGDVPNISIIRILYQLGKTYFNIKDYTNALKHFNVIIPLLENEKESIKKEEYKGISALHLGLIYLEQNNSSESKKNLKKAFYIGNNKSEKVKLKYHLISAKYYKNKGNLSKAHKLLTTSLENFEATETTNKNILIDLFLELAELYIHSRKSAKKSLYYLDTIKDFLSKDKISGILRTLRWNVLMSDYYKFMAKDNENFSYYQRQSKTLRNQLKIIGLEEFD